MHDDSSDGDGAEAGSGTGASKHKRKRDGTGAAPFTGVVVWCTPNDHAVAKTRHATIAAAARAAGVGPRMLAARLRRAGGWNDGTSTWSRGEAPSTNGAAAAAAAGDPLVRVLPTPAPAPAPAPAAAPKPIRSRVVTNGLSPADRERVMAARKFAGRHNYLANNDWRRDVAAYAKALRRTPVHRRWTADWVRDGRPRLYSGDVVDCLDNGTMSQRWCVSQVIASTWSMTSGWTVGIRFLGWAEEETLAASSTRIQPFGFRTKGEWTGLASTPILRSAADAALIGAAAGAGAPAGAAGAAPAAPAAPAAGPLPGDFASAVAVWRASGCPTGWREGEEDALREGSWVDGWDPDCACVDWLGRVTPTVGGWKPARIAGPGGAAGAARRAICVSGAVVDRIAPFCSETLGRWTGRPGPIHGIIGGWRDTAFRLHMVPEPLDADRAARSAMLAQCRVENLAFRARDPTPAAMLTRGRMRIAAYVDDAVLGEDDAAWRAAVLEWNAAGRKRAEWTDAERSAAVRRVGTAVDCCAPDGNSWTSAAIAAVEADGVVVHHFGWSHTHDEALPLDSVRLHPFATQTLGRWTGSGLQYYVRETSAAGDMRPQPPVEEQLRLPARGTRPPGAAPAAGPGLIAAPVAGDLVQVDLVALARATPELVEAVTCGVCGTVPESRIVLHCIGSQHFPTPEVISRVLRSGGPMVAARMLISAAAGQGAIVCRTCLPPSLTALACEGSLGSGCWVPTPASSAVNVGSAKLVRMKCNMRSTIESLPALAIADDRGADTRLVLHRHSHDHDRGSKIKSSKAKDKGERESAVAQVPLQSTGDYWLSVDQAVRQLKEARLTLEEGAAMYEAECGVCKCPLWRPQTSARPGGGVPRVIWCGACSAANCTGCGDSSRLDADLRKTPLSEWCKWHTESATCARAFHHHLMRLTPAAAGPRVDSFVTYTGARHTDEQVLALPELVDHAVAKAMPRCPSCGVLASKVRPPTQPLPHPHPTLHTAPS